LDAIEDLDQEEIQLENILCTESHATAGISKDTVNTLGLGIPIPSLSQLKI
jgi:hypothetical protein